MRKPITDEESIRRYGDGDLSPAERRAVEARIAQSAGLQHMVEKHERLRCLVRQGGGRFDGFFAARVMARLRELSPAAEAWMAELRLAFRRVVVVGFALAGMLIVHNVAVQWHLRDSRSVVELTLSIPPATIETSLEYLDFGL